MFDHLLSLLSLAAYFACAALLSWLIRSLDGPPAPAGEPLEARAAELLERLGENGTRRGEAARLGAKASALACFAFIPPGSLPPFIDLPQGGIFALLLFWAASLCAAGSGNSARPAGVFSHYLRLLLPAIFLTLVFAALAGQAWLRALPGGPFNLGSYAAMSVWQGVGFGDNMFYGSLRLSGAPLEVPAFAGCVLLWFCLLFAAPAVFTLRRVAFFAFAVVFFAPRKIAFWLDLSGWQAFALDYLLFWFWVFVFSRFAASLEKMPLRLPLALAFFACGTFLLVPFSDWSELTRIF